MVFSSPIFLFYFLPLICVVYLLTPARAKNAVLLLGSLGFYAWGAGHFAAVLIASIAVNYALGLAIHWAAQGEREGILRCAVAGTVAVNLSLLAYYKYANFVAGELAVEGWVQIALPIGISFFTFQSMSYALSTIGVGHSGFSVSLSVSIHSCRERFALFQQNSHGRFTGSQDITLGHGSGRWCHGESDPGGSDHRHDGC